MAAGYYNQTPRRFSRRWWIARGKTPLWVVVVTVLIWVYADLEFTKTQDIKENVYLDLQTGPNMALLTENSIRVALKVQGNANAIEQFERTLKAQNYRLSVDISDVRIGLSRMSGEDLLSRSEEFKKSGLSIVPGTIQTQRIELDRMVEETVPVKFEYTGAKLLAQATHVDPQTVQIRCASRQWADIQKATSNAPVIRTQEVNLRDRAPGKPQSIKVPLLPQIGNVPVELDKTAVTVEFQISHATETKSIKLYVDLLMPQAWGDDDTWEKYKLQKFDPVQWNPEVNVTGSPEALEQLLSRGKDIEAFIKLTDDDKTPVDSWITRGVIVLFPPDLNVELAPGKHPEIKFKLVKQR